MTVLVSKTFSIQGKTFYRINSNAYDKMSIHYRASVNRLFILQRSVPCHNMEQAVPSEAEKGKSSTEDFRAVRRGDFNHSNPNNQLATYFLESIPNPGSTRHEGIVTLLTKVLGDGAKWYDYEVFEDKSLIIEISHRSGEKWTRFLESFLQQCVRLAGVSADLSVEGNHLNLVFREYYGESRAVSQTFWARPSEGSRREVAVR